MQTRGCISHCGMNYRISGKIPNHDKTHLYLIIRCYFKFPELNESYETRGSEFMQAIEHRLYPVNEPAKNDSIELELFTMYCSIWAVVGVPKEDLNKVRQLAGDMRLEMEKGVPSLFQNEFPMQDKDNLWFIRRDLKKCTLLNKK